MAESKIVVYRFGRWMRELPDTKKAVKEWILANVPYDDGISNGIPNTFSFEECLKIAEYEHYAFRRKRGGTKG